MLLQRITDLRPGEGLRVSLAAAWFCALLTTNYSLRPLRDAMGIAGGVRDLHWLFTASFLVMLAAVPLFGLALARFDRRRLVTFIHRFFASNLLLFFVLMQGWLGDDPNTQLWTARGFFVWMSVFNLFVISLFWSVMADLFTQNDARRLFGLISVGGSIGAIAGPTIGGALALWVDPAVLPLVGAVLLQLSLVAMRGVVRTAEPEGQPKNSAPGPDSERHLDPEPGPVGGGALAAFPDLLRSPTLLGICAYVLLMTMSSTMLYFIQAQIVSEQFVDDASRTAVFAGVDLCVNILTLIGQGLFTGRILRRIGLSWALALLPLLCLGGFVVLAMAPVLMVLIGVQIIRRASNYAIAKPAREVLYTDVDRSQRYRAKNLIDTVVYRGGDALTGWAFTGLQALGLGLAGVALAAAPLAGIWALVGAAIGRRADRAVSLDEETAPSR